MTLPKRRIRTLAEVVACGESGSLQFAVRHKFDVQVAATGVDVSRALLATVAAEERREAEGPVSDLDVVKLAFPGRLDGILVVKEQVDALPRRGCKEGKERRSEVWRRRWERSKVTFYDVDTLPLRRVFLRVVRGGKIPSIRFLDPGPTLPSWCHS